jgi:hypothetical protein
MSLLLVQHDRRTDRIVTVEATELSPRFARRECMARNESVRLRPSPFVYWQVHELGDIPLHDPTTALIEALTLSLTPHRRAS